MRAALLDDSQLSRPMRKHEQARLATEALTAYAYVRWMLRRRSLPSAIEALRRPLELERAQPASERTEILTGARLGWAVTRALSPLPSDTRCLMRSLVLTRLLARRGIPAKLVISVHPGEALGAHAWLEHHGRPLLPMTEEDRAHRMIEL